ncbi:MAG: hypothetical protein LUQ25_00125 [Methanoregulaceae archaeon]|nr:hypothetical protein [Methanoregulaceae archaeon]
MKRILCITFLLVTVALLCGCTTTTPVNDAAIVRPPVLIGNWTGPMNAYVEGVGYTDFQGETITLLVTEQHDRIFSGTLYFLPAEPGDVPQEFAGVIDRDGRTFRLVEEGGYSTGTLVSPDEMDVIYLDTTKPFSVAIDSLKRTR